MLSTAARMRSALTFRLEVAGVAARSAVAKGADSAGAACHLAEVLVGTETVGTVPLVFAWAEVAANGFVAVAAAVPVLSGLLAEPLEAFDVAAPSPVVAAAVRRVGSAGADAELAAASEALTASLAASLAAGATLALATVTSEGVTDWLPEVGLPGLPPPQPETSTVDASRQARVRGIKGAGRAGDFMWQARSQAENNVAGEGELDCVA